MARPTRREPFADSSVGARGLRTHQRILDAALETFAESGYDRASLDRVAELAGCSRVTIYQYANGKDGLFRRLGAQASTQMWSAMEGLDDITADASGHASLRAFVSRLGDVEARYAPVIRAFDAVAEGDGSLTGEAATILRRGVGLLEARLVGTDLAPRAVESTVALLNPGIVRALSHLATLRAAAPEFYGRERVDLAIADVAHRVLFGPLPGVNVRPPATADAAPKLHLSAESEAILQRARALDVSAAGPTKRALRAMLDAAAGLVLDQGFRGLRIDAIVRAAGVSRGSFYTYFDDIGDFVNVVGVRGIRKASAVMEELPDDLAPTAFRHWLRHYADVNRTSGPLVRAWLEATTGPLRQDRAAVIDDGRRQLAQTICTRAIGQAEVDAAILLAITDVFASQSRSNSEVGVMVTMVERGFLVAQT